MKIFYYFNFLLICHLKFMFCLEASLNLKLQAIQQRLLPSRNILIPLLLPFGEFVLRNRQFYLLISLSLTSSLFTEMKKKKKNLAVLILLHTQTFRKYSSCCQTGLSLALLTTQLLSFLTALAFNLIFSTFSKGDGEK